MKLEHGRKYAAELSLPSIPFVNVKSRAVDRLTDAGFQNVRVYDAADGKTYAEGTWGGSTQDVDGEIDSHILRVWPL